MSSGSTQLVKKSQVAGRTQSGLFFENVSSRIKLLFLRHDQLLPTLVPGNKITLLQNGEAYFAAMEAAFDRAVHEIYLETYIFENDTAGKRIAAALSRAALRGVQTHLLIDGFGSHALPQSMTDQLLAAGVQLVWYRKFLRLCGRQHRQQY